MQARSCPECGSATSLLPERTLSKNIKYFRCGNGHVIQADVADKRNVEITSISIPFKELEACPECHRMDLKKVHDEKYPTEKGYERFVIYVCSNGHRTNHRQLVMKQFNVPPKELWEGY